MRRVRRPNHGLVFFSGKRFAGTSVFLLPKRSCQAGPDVLTICKPCKDPSFPCELLFLLNFFNLRVCTLFSQYLRCFPRKRFLSPFCLNKRGRLNSFCSTFSCMIILAILTIRGPEKAAISSGLKLTQGVHLEGGAAERSLQPLKVL